MKKKFLFLMTLLAVSLLALAEMTVYVYKKDGTKVPYVASTVDSIGFVNVHTITFNANGGTGSMDVVRVKDGESIALPANGFTYAKAEFAGWNTAANGSGTAYADKGSVKPTANITLYAQWESITSGFVNGHEWVDLGLPSGTKWATCNVGADSPEDYGDYFAWGETTTKSTYDWSTYKWCRDSYDTMTKYCIDDFWGTVEDNKIFLDYSDDVAYVKWGSPWKMPTTWDMKELMDANYTTWTWTTQNGISGYKVTSKVNGNSIFLPAAGYRGTYDLLEAGSDGYYWSSSLDTGNSSYAYHLSFGSDYVGSYNYSRRFGSSVRPVLRE